MSQFESKVSLRIGSLSVQYSRNETILKIDHHAKATAFAKSLLWVKK